MSEQKLISKYLVNKVPIKYEEIKSNLQKKNKKIMNYLVSLTFYQPEESISEFIVPYSLSGSSSDKKLNQLATYFLCHAFGDECKAITNSINLYQKELDNKSNALYKKMLAMKVMSIFLSPLDNLAKSNLLNHISEGLRANMNKSTDKNKKKKGSVREKCLWEYSAISTLKHKFKMAPSIFIPIVDCLKSEYAAVTRNAAILCYNHAVEEPQKVASTFTKFSEIVSTKKDPEIEFNLKDPIAKIYLIKMFTQLANSSEVTNADLFYGAITYFAQDKNMRVSFEAITAFTKIPTWEKFEDFVIPYEEKKLIKIAIDKLSQGLLNTESLPMIHNAARVVAILAESHREFIGDVVSEEDGQSYPLEDIVEPLKTLLNNESVHIRAQALKAFIWLTSSSDGYEVENKITVEFIRNKFPGFLFDEIFEELKRRTEKTPKIASNTLDIVFCWCKHLPEKANMRIIGEIWNTVMKFTGGNALVVENIYTILDIENQSKDRDFLHFVKKNVYFFLGEHSHILSATPQQEGNYFASIKNNPTLKSIVLRLENAASIGSTEVRSLAVTALAKTAFRSNFETRLHIFQFLNNMDESVTAKIDVFPVLQILDRLFNSLKKWNVVVKQSFGGDLSTEQQEQFQKDNKALLNDISYYCEEFKDSFCALGPKFSQFL